MSLRRSVIFSLGGLDVDAKAFLDAAVITSNTQRTAINNLVVSLKANSLWTKFNAIYPVIGGTSSSHKFNLKNPLDTDAAYRLVFSGGITHSNTGMLFNGSNGYANTKLNVSSVLSQNNTHISFYGEYYSVAEPYGMGVFNGNNSLWIRSSKTTRTLDNSCNNNFTNIQVYNCSKLVIHTRSSSTQWKRYMEGNSTTTVTVNSASLVNQEMVIGALNSGTINNYANTNCKFVTIGSGLNETEAANFTAIVSTYQTTLSRA